ncbi:MAG: hypothetical protein HKO07_07990, partial [Pseudomonadales bacterium]|nr:hypothetical protein [Pseudomonadales bacterium]
GREYYDFTGAHRKISHQSRMACLRAMDIAVDDPAAVDAAIFELDAKPWTQLLRPLQIADAGENVHVELRLPALEGAQVVSWTMTSEHREEHSGAASLSELSEQGEYHLDGVRYAAYAVPLGPVSAGYYRLSVLVDEQQAEATIAVCPATCYTPREHKPGTGAQRSWGLSCHLYTVRSENNWGIGDFADLKALARYGAGVGMDFLLLNPLHAPNFSSEDFASPYSASDRRFLNPLYISLPDAAEFLGAKKLRQQFDLVLQQEQIEQLRSASHVDYPALAKLKLTALRELFDWFVAQAGDARNDAQKKVAAQYQAFSQYRQPALNDFAAHAAAHPPPGVNYAP